MTFRRYLSALAAAVSIATLVALIAHDERAVAVAPSPTAARSADASVAPGPIAQADQPSAGSFDAAGDVFDDGSDPAATLALASVGGCAPRPPLWVPRACVVVARARAVLAVAPKTSPPAHRS